ncbi:MAG: hypothetical protein ACRDPM_15600 [Solirubrobacteraceae bacterium]
MFGDPGVQPEREQSLRDPDLLWGLRGGGGNFGIVTSFEYALHPVGPEIMAGGVLHSFADAPEVFRYFAELSRAPLTTCRSWPQRSGRRRGCPLRPKWTASW